MKIKITIDSGSSVESYELSRYYEVDLERYTKATPLAALHIALGLSPEFIYESLTVEVTGGE